MNYKNKIKNKKGITLIALIVIIVILVIITAITINAFNDDEGLVSKSRNAVSNFSKSQEDEASVLKTYDIDKIAQGTKSSSWTYNLTNETVSNSVITLKIGDYVNYQCLNYSNYGGGADIEPAWRVFGAENGKLLLISDLPLYSSRSNNLFEGCEMFGTGTGAESARPLSIDDLCNIVGGDVITVNNNSYNLRTDSRAYLWMYTEEDLGEKSVSYESYRNLFNDKEYYKMNSLKNERMKVVLLSGITRVKNFYGDDSFYIKRDDNLVSEVYMNFFDLANSTDREYPTSGNIRPIITLKENIKLTQATNGSWNISE